MTVKQPKPIFISALYAVLKRGNGSYVVTLASNYDNVQFSTQCKQFAVSWAESNS